MTSRHSGSDPEFEPDSATAAVASEPEVAPLPAEMGRPSPQPWRRPRWVGFAGGVALFLLLFVALGLRGSDSGGRESPLARPTPSATQSSGQRTLLIQVRNDNDLGSNNLIAGVSGGLPPAQVLVPSRLIVDVPGTGQQTLAQSARALNRSASQDALSNLLALRIDGTLSLGRLALAGMVDYVGGITLTVGQQISEERPETGQARVVVPKGRVHLNGTQAAAYALTWLPDEPETARLRRYCEVMTETIRRLPTDQLRVEAMLTSLGGQARTTTTTGDVASYLITMGKEIRAGGQQVRLLPTTDTDSGEALAMVRVDLAAADDVLAEVLPTAMRDESTARPRVVVQNGVGTAGLGSSARGRLSAAGMVYINGGNAGELGYLHTRILVANKGAASVETGAEIAKALGVAPSSLEVSQSVPTGAAALVILGRDFKP